MTFVRPWPSRFVAVITLTLIALGSAACAGGNDTPEEGTVSPAPATGSSGDGEGSGLYDPAVLQAAGRTEDDHYRDEGFKPLQVYEFFGIDSGMTVVDLASSGMYNAHILSQIVGPEGRVIATATYATEAREGALDRLQQTLDQRNVDGVLDNVEIVETLEQIPADSVDVLLTVRNYHDLGDHEARSASIPRLLRVLKPGGILAGVDAHTDKTEERDESVHRINEGLARQEIEGGGFRFLDSSDVLHNANDTFDFDGRRPGDPIHRYFIHRWVMKFQKPAN